MTPGDPCGAPAPRCGSAPTGLPRSSRGERKETVKAPILVTGATGLVGNAIARRLAERGDRVRALVRDPVRARPILPAQVELVQGDVTAPDTLVEATRGARLVFHAAGLPEQWQRDEGVFDRVNRGGTASVLSAAKSAGVERVVYTSTMDVFAAPPGGTLGSRTSTRRRRRPRTSARSRRPSARRRPSRAQGSTWCTSTRAACTGRAPSSRR
jgi:nucleoside-diphosphate-sugar epimerase